MTAQAVVPDNRPGANGLIEVQNEEALYTLARPAYRRRHHRKLVQLFNS